MREFANPMPVRIISEMLGVPQELQGHIRRVVARDCGVSRQSQSHGGRSSRGARCADRVRRSFSGRPWRNAGRNKGNDLISLLIDIEEEGEVLTEEELYAQCIALLFAGHETTRNLIGNGMYTLLKNPEEDSRTAREAGDDPLRSGGDCCATRAPYNSQLVCSRKILRSAASGYRRDGRCNACSVRRTGIPNNSRNRTS